MLNFWPKTTGILGKGNIRKRQFIAVIEIITDKELYQGKRRGRVWYYTLFVNNLSRPGLMTGKKQLFFTQRDCMRVAHEITKQLRAKSQSYKFTRLDLPDPYSRLVNVSRSKSAKVETLLSSISCNVCKSIHSLQRLLDLHCCQVAIKQPKMVGFQIL